jgi:hypothetical protein
MSGRFSEGTREQLATATAHGLLSAADYARLAAMTGTFTSADEAKLDSLQVPVLRLAYDEAADTLNGAAVAAGSQTDVIANQNFTVSNNTSVLIFEVRAAVLVNGANLTGCGLRANIDSAGTPTLVKLGGASFPVNGIATAPGATFVGNGFAPGAHTIKVQLYVGAASTANCRCAGAPNQEFVGIRIWELTP